MPGHGPCAGRGVDCGDTTPIGNLRTLASMATVPTRREPPQFREVGVVRTEARSPHMVRITLGGPALEGFDGGLPAASVRVLLPGDGDDLVMPEWNGNEFLLDDGSRPIIRTLTPLRLAPDPLELDVDVVLHGDGPLSAWAASARPGDRVAVSGTGRGYEIDPDARAYLLAGDESALPAIGVLLRALPADAEVQVLVEVRHLDARVELHSPSGATVEWFELEPDARPGDALVAAVTSARLEPDVRVWAAGEAAAVHRIRRYLFTDQGLPRSRAVVRGYWKHGRNADTDGDAE